MNAKQIARVLIVVLAALALTALVAAAQDAPDAPQKTLPAVTEIGQSASPAATLYESEPNNGFGTADVMGLRDVMGGKIGTAGDIDYFHLTDDYMPGYTALIDIDAVVNGSPLDAVICLYNEDFVLIECNDDNDGHDSMLYVYLDDPEDDWELHFYVTVREFAPDKGGNDYTYTLSVSRPYFVSPVANGTVNGLPFQKGDILAHTGYEDGSSKWILFFDASDFGITQNINSIEVSTERAAIVFQKNQQITGGLVATPYDVVEFLAYQWGPATLGTFTPSFILDGSTVGLTAASEKIDALSDVYANGNVVISTTGAVTVPMAGGGNLKAKDEDLITLTAATGKWSLYFDGSTVPGLAVEDVIAADRASDSVDPWIDLVIQGNGVLNGFSVNQKEIFIYYPDYPDESQPDGWTVPFNMDAISFSW